MVNQYQNGDESPNDIAITLDGLSVDDLDSTYAPGTYETHEFKVRISDNQPVTEDASVVFESADGVADLRTTSMKCNFDETDCWTLRVHPRVDLLSSYTGTESGGESLTITGQGFGNNASDVSVKIGQNDADCQVTSVT